MSSEKALALVIRGSDWSETSRIVTLWTREFGKIRALAKGARRLKSAFESSLDILNVCDIVVLRKTSGSLDLLTEAKVHERFPHMRRHLPSWYAGQYVAELLGDWAEENDPHPILFDEALGVLRDLGRAEDKLGPRLARFELVLLQELGYGPALNHCAGCEVDVVGQGLAFSSAKGGVVCSRCQAGLRDLIALSPDEWKMLLTLREPGSEAWKFLDDLAVRRTIRRLLGDYVTYVRGRKPRLLPYLGS